MFWIVLFLAGTYALTIDMIAVELAGISSAARTSNELIDAPTPNPGTTTSVLSLQRLTCGVFKQQPTKRQILWRAQLKKIYIELTGATRAILGAFD